MIDTRLIMLEGLPGTGKSTNSYFLLTQLERNGIMTQWSHEVARPHPTLFFNEASLTYIEYNKFLEKYPEAKFLDNVAVFRKTTVGIDMLEIEWNYLSIIGQDAFKALQEFDVWNYSLEKYIEIALEKWAVFVEKALNENNEVYILDSSIFQFQIFSFLLKNAPYVNIERFIHKLVDIIKPLNPSLIYFYREDTEDTVNFLEKIRGTQFMENIWERDKSEPYYQDKPNGAEGHRQFLRDYASIAMKLFTSINCKKLSIEISNGDWKGYEQKMLSFLGIENIPSPRAIPSYGKYKNVKLNFEIDVNGLTIKDPCGVIRKLIPKSENEFYVECLPAVLLFNEQEQIIIAGNQICERWTTLGTTYEKVGN